jgi:hypothetical protein
MQLAELSKRSIASVTMSSKADPQLQHWRSQKKLKGWWRCCEVRSRPAFPDAALNLS